MSLNDVGIAVASLFVFAQAGGAVFLAVAQSVLLNNILPQIQLLNPTITRADLLTIGIPDLKRLVAASQIPALILAFAHGLDWVFRALAVVSGVAALVALGVQWKGVKEKKKGKEVK